MGTYNQELVRCIEDLREKREEVNRSILRDEEEKARCQRELTAITERLGKLNEGLARKMQARLEFDQTIQETEAAYMKVRAGRGVLLCAPEPTPPFTQRTQPTHTHTHQPTRARLSDSREQPNAVRCSKAGEHDPDEKEAKRELRQVYYPFSGFVPILALYIYIFFSSQHHPSPQWTCATVTTTPSVRSAPLPWHSTTFSPCFARPHSLTYRIASSRVLTTSRGLPPLISPGRTSTACTPRVSIRLCATASSATLRARAGGGGLGCV